MRLVAGLLFCVSLAAAQSFERWGIYEVKLAGPTAGNPFVDVRLEAAFHFRNRIVTVDGFYDTFEARFTLKLPGKPYLAVRFHKGD